MKMKLCLVLVLATGVGSFAPVAAPVCVRSVCHAGFASPNPKKKSPTPKKTSKSNLNEDWVELKELDLGALSAGGPAQAVGRSMSGKPYLVRRLGDESVVATSVACGRCDYPLLKAPVSMLDDTFEVKCDMCGAAFDAETGKPRPNSGGGGNPLFSPLLRSKPQKNLLVYPTKELADGRVFVNINSKKL